MGTLWATEHTKIKFLFLVRGTFGQYETRYLKRGYANVASNNSAVRSDGLCASMCQESLRVKLG